MTTEPGKWTNTLPLSGDRVVAEITLSSPQVEEYQRKLDAQEFGDLLLFILGHECAHIAQDRRKVLRDVPQLVKECEADLWAGAAFLNVVPDSQPPQETMNRVLSIVSLAAETGDVVPSGGGAARELHHHPRPEQRALCTARGVSAGLQLRLDKAYERTKSTATQRQADQVRRFDPDMFDAGADLWAWSLTTARQIVGDQIQSPELGGSEADLKTLMKSLASATEHGSEALIQSATILSFPPPIRCVVEKLPNMVSLTCTAPPLPSETLAFVAFDSWAWLLRTELLSRGWDRGPSGQPSMERAEDFTRGAAYASIRLIAGTGELVLAFSTRA